MQNRPTTRRHLAVQMRTATLERAAAEAGAAIERFGQGQPSGFLTPERRDTWYGGSLGYVSSLPTNAGFGLAEHEALASGCPLLAMAWGDTPVTLAGYPGLCFDGERLAARLREASARLAEPHDKDSIVAGFDLLLTHYTRSIMDDGIHAMIAALSRTFQKTSSSPA